MSWPSTSRQVPVPTSRAASSRVVVFAALIYAAVGCTSVTADLTTARDLYRDARYEDASVWLADLESELPGMNTTDRATYHFLAGMTAYRLAQYQDALHDLALSAYVVSTQENALTPTQRAVLERTLAELTPTDASPHARSPRASSDR